MLEDYKQWAPRIMLTEMKKRGTTQQHSTVKQRTTSPIGWGVVRDTFPKFKKGCGRNIALYAKQIAYMDSVPPAAEPAKKRLKQMVPEEVELPTPPPPPQKAVVPSVVSEWYSSVGSSYEKGAIGFVPEPYQAHGPPGTLDEWLETNVGLVLLNFCRFLKNKLF